MAQENLIDIDTKGKALKEIIRLIEKDYGFLFSYKEDDVNQLTILQAIPPSTITTFLTSLLTNSTQLEFELVDQRFVILRKKSHFNGWWAFP